MYSSSKVAPPRDSGPFLPKLRLTHSILYYFSSLFTRTGRTIVGSSEVVLQLLIQTYVPFLLSSSSDRFQLQRRQPQVESFLETIAKITAAAANVARRIKTSAKGAEGLVLHCRLVIE